MGTQILLGPQGLKPNLREVLDDLAVEGPVVSITAGWRDTEGEIEALQNDIGRPVNDLRLYHRAEDIFAHEPEMRAMHRERQDRLLELQSLYRIRLTPTLLAARKLLRLEGDPELLRMEQRAAITQVRALDRHHVKRIAAIHKEYDLRHVDVVGSIASRHLDEVHEQIQKAGLVLIAGGHVAVLLNRIRLFRLTELLAQKPVVGWSAGAMVLCNRIVLFHDNAPQGKRDAEILDAGLGLLRQVVPLPHAKTRLDWSSRSRMALFSRRFAPARCCTLDAGTAIRVEDNKIVAASGSSVITRSGRKKSLVPR